MRPIRGLILDPDPDSFMRIIAGELRGRRLVAPKGSGTRPTTDRIREALFQHLTVARIDGGFADRHVLDLFAGSGALGLEALSRGAESVTLVDEARSALAALRTNVDSLGVRRSAKLRAPWCLVFGAIVKRLG